MQILSSLARSRASRIADFSRSAVRFTSAGDTGRPLLFLRSHAICAFRWRRAAASTHTLCHASRARRERHAHWSIVAARFRVIGEGGASGGGGGLLAAVGEIRSGGGMKCTTAKRA